MNPSQERGHFILAGLWAALLLVSIGTALGKGQPWLLAHPERRHRIAVTGTPLSIEVPRSLGAGQSGTEGEGSRSWIFTSALLSPLQLAVIALPFPSADEHDRFIATRWETNRAAAGKTTPPFTTRELTISGLPTLELSQTLPSGQRYLILIQARQSYLVRLELLIPPGISPSKTPNLEELLATMQDAPR